MKTKKKINMKPKYMQVNHNLVTIINDYYLFSLHHSALAAAKDNIPVFKYKRWQMKKVAIPEVLEEYKSVGAELNVLPFCSQFIPMDVINFPKYQSIIYHPSLLPRHRGASAINWYVYIKPVHVRFIETDLGPLNAYT